jgi:hypothetical protein
MGTVQTGITFLSGLTPYYGVESLEGCGGLFKFRANFRKFYPGVVAIAVTYVSRDAYVVSCNAFINLQTRDFLEFCPVDFCPLQQVCTRSSSIVKCR